MEYHTELSCEELLHELFPNGFASDDIMAAIAPDGWENSPYVQPTPTIEQEYQGAKARHSLDSLMARITTGKITPIEEFESLDAFQARYQTVPRDNKKELQETIANCLWDIFSDNNDVMKDGKNFHLGSFRGSASFLAEWLNKTIGTSYSYIDFYMGNTARDGKCDHMPVHELIFARLKAAGCDWIFHFTELQLIDLRGANKQESPKPEDYDPNKALEQTLKEEADQKAAAELRARIEETNAKAREDALYKPPPKTVQAYRKVFGEFPVGWPPA